MPTEKITTADCKVFINSISPILGEPKNKWARTRKYNGTWNQEVVPFRDFVNETNSIIITLAQTSDGLVLYSVTRIEPSEDIELFGEWQFEANHQISTQDVCEFMAWCVAQDPQVVDSPEDQEFASISSSWEAFELEQGCGSVEVFYETSDLPATQVVNEYECLMPDFDTAFRFAVYQTDDNRLVLGANNPD